MNPNWLGVFSAILAFAAFYATYRWAKPLPFKRRMQFFALSCLLAIPGASFSLYYLHLTSPPAWYFQFRSIPGAELLILFIGVSSGLLASLVPRRYLVVPLLGAAAFCIVPFIKPFIGPLSPDSLTDRWHEDICMQSTRSTCGAASTASILRKLGMEVTEAEIARDAHSYGGGTEAWYLARAIRSRGFKTCFIFSPGFTPENGLPAIVGVRLGSIGHFIAIIEEKDGIFIVGDPMRGREEVSREELEGRYEFTDFHMHVRKDSEH